MRTARLSLKVSALCILASLPLLAPSNTGAGLLGGLLGGGGGTPPQGDDPVALGYDAKSQSNGGGGTLPVIPSMDGCRDNGNGTFTAWWGYFNKNNHNVNIPIGNKNKFHPGTANRGQPTSFQAGDQDSVFSTTFTGESLTWILDGRTATIQSCNCVAGCPFQDSLVEETWDTFDPAKWEGDGDQQVAGGYFGIRPLAFSAFADYKNAAPVTIEPNAVLHFDQTFRLTYPLVQLFTQSAAVYMVNRDKDGTFENYAFVDIGYTGGLMDNRLYVEIFGADGGIGFDQLVITDVPASPDQTIAVDLRITNNSYSVAVNGTVVNTVALTTPLPQIDLFQVGVQRNLVGLEGRIDGTFLYKTCQ